MNIYNCNGIVTCNYLHHNWTICYICTISWQLKVQRSRDSKSFVVIMQEQLNNEEEFLTIHTQREKKIQKWCRPQTWKSLKKDIEQKIFKNTKEWNEMKEIKNTHTVLLHRVVWSTVTSWTTIQTRLGLLCLCLSSLGGWLMVHRDSTGVQHQERGSDVEL